MEEFTMKYKVGDKVKMARKPLEEHSYGWISTMCRLEGKVYEIVGIFDGYYQLETGHFVFDEDIEGKVE